MKKLLATTAILFTATPPAFAGPLELKPIIDARLRYEHVEQKPPRPRCRCRHPARIRGRLRGEDRQSFSFLAEAEGTLAIFRGL